MEKTDKWIGFWKTMDTSSNNLSWKYLDISKLIHRKKGSCSTRYAAEKQICLSVAKKFAIRPFFKFIDDKKDVKFKDKFLKYILNFSEKHLLIKGPKGLFYNTRIKYTHKKFQYSNANELKSYLENKFKRLKVYY